MIKEQGIEERIEKAFYWDIMFGKNSETLKEFKKLVFLLLEQQREEIRGAILTNQRGAFRDDGGNDCWYLSDLLKLPCLQNKEK